MKTYAETIVKLRRDVEELYLSGNQDPRLKNLDVVSFIYGVSVKQIDKDIRGSK